MGQGANKVPHVVVVAANQTVAKKTVALLTYGMAHCDRESNTHRHPHNE